MRQTLQPLELHVRAVGPWPMNSSVVICPDSKQSLLVDPGAEPETLLAMLGSSHPIAILLTHTHPDHVGALDEMRARLAVPVLAHAGPHWNHFDPRADRTLADGEALRLGHHTLHLRHTPGHTQDMLCLELGDGRVIVGDTLFAGGPGRTWSSDDFQRTLQTLRALLRRWPDETQCYPGHGPAFRLGDVRPRIEQFLARDHGTFFGDADW